MDEKDHLGVAVIAVPAYRRMQKLSNNDRDSNCKLRKWINPVDFISGRKILFLALYSIFY